MLQVNHIYAHALEPHELGQSIPVVRIVNQLNINVHDSHSVSRKRVESFILDKFQDRHSASIREFMPLLIDLSLDQEKSAVVGIRSGSGKSFFLETYLDHPIEVALHAIADHVVSRDSIVEIGNFAADNIRLGSLLFTILANGLLLAGYQWMVFTATNEVEKMINMLGCEQAILADADVSRVQASSTDWGSYYDNNPKVIACNLQGTIAKAETNIRLNQVFLNYSDEIMGLAVALKSVGKGVYL